MTDDHSRFVVRFRPVVYDAAMSEPANRTQPVHFSSKRRGPVPAMSADRGRCALSLQRQSFLARIVETGAELGLSAEADIPTKRGLVPVGEASVTDHLITWSGYRRLTCCSSETLSAAELERFPGLRPIRLPSSLLGDPVAMRTSCRDGVRPSVLVSPGTQILVDSDLIHEMTGYRKVLIAARDLLHLEEVSVETSLRQVTYVQPITRAQEIFNSCGFRFATPLDDETLDLLLSGPRYEHSRLRLARERAEMSAVALSSLAPTLSDRTAASVVRAHRDRKIPLLRPGTLRR